MAETNEYMTTRQYAISRDRDYGTSSTVVQSIIREDTGKKYVRKDHNLKYAKEEIPALKINYTAEELQIIVDMYKAGSSDEQIGKEIHRSTGAVSVKLSALRKKGLIKCRTCHNKPIDNVSKKTEKVDIEVESKKFMEDLEPPHIAQETVKEPDETTNEEIGSTKVILIPAKPTLGQFIDLVAKYGWELGFFSIQEGKKEITFREVEYYGEELQNIIDMHNVGCSDEKIGVEIGRSDGTISEILSALRKNGVINFVEEGE